MKYRLYKEHNSEWLHLKTGVAWAPVRPDGLLPDSNDPINIGWSIAVGDRITRDLHVTEPITDIIKLTSYEIIFKTGDETFKLETTY